MPELSNIDDPGPTLCPSCGHHMMLHAGPEGECLVRMIAPGQFSFSEAPICGCVGAPADAGAK